MEFTLASIKNVESLLEKAVNEPYISTKAKWMLYDIIDPANAALDKIEKFRLSLVDKYGVMDEELKSKRISKQEDLEKFYTEMNELLIQTTTLPVFEITREDFVGDIKELTVGEIRRLIGFKPFKEEEVKETKEVEAIIEE